MRLEDCCTACFVPGCRTVVCLDADPAALCDCGAVTCGDHDCPDCPKETTDAA